MARINPLSTFGNPPATPLPASEKPLKPARQAAPAPAPMPAKPCAKTAKKRAAILAKLPDSIFHYLQGGTEGDAIRARVDFLSWWTVTTSAPSDWRTAWAAWKASSAKPEPDTAATQPANSPVPSDDWRTVPGKKIGNYPSPCYEFTLSDRSRVHVFVGHSQGMKEAREGLHEKLASNSTAPTATENASPVKQIPEPTPTPTLPPVPVISAPQCDPIAKALAALEAI